MSLDLRYTQKHQKKTIEQHFGREPENALPVDWKDFSVNIIRNSAEK